MNVAEEWVPHPVHDVLAARAAVPDGGVVADLGCGPGWTLAALRRRWPRARMVGVDLAADALDVARHGGAALVRADLSRPLPLADACVDVVVCHNVIELLPDPGILFAEARRVLRRAGRAVWSHTDFASVVVHGADPGLTEVICQAYARVPQRWMAHIDPSAGRRIPGLARRAGLAVDEFTGHVVAADQLVGHVRRRVDEITAVVRRHAAAGRAEVTEARVLQWRARLDEADTRGEFSFAETAFITITSR